MVTYKIFPYPDKFASVTVLNYQAVIGFFKKGLELNLQYKYYYVIFDEVHFFLEDALFNPYTENCLYELFYLMCDSVKIFISATIEETKKLLDVIPPENFKLTKSRFEYDLAKKDERYYSAISKTPKYIPYLFQNESVLLKAIKEDALKNKWLIFVSSKQYGRELQTRILNLIDKLLLDNKILLHQHRAKIRELKREERREQKERIKELEQEEKRLQKCKVSFLCSENKNNMTTKNIIDDESYDEAVLIATKVLDNGINIKDTAIKNVVIPFSYRVEFLQMLGRKRLEKGEKVNLYIQYPSYYQVVSKSKYYANLKAKYEQIKDCNTLILSKNHHERFLGQKTMTKILQKFWNESDAVRNLFCINKDRNLQFNVLAEFQLLMLEGFYSNLEKSYLASGYKVVAEIINDWLDKQLVRFPVHLQEKLYGSLEEFIKNNLNIPINLEDQEDFYEKYIAIFGMWCAKRYAKEPEKLLEWNRIKKGKDRRKAAICKSLQIAELPYTLVKRDGSWVLIDISK